MKPAEPEPEEPPAVDWAAEERLTYAPQLPNAPDRPPEEGANGAVEPSSREGARSTTDAPEHHAPQ
jgi:hypothetical protein